MCSEAELEIACIVTSDFTRSLAKLNTISDVTFNGLCVTGLEVTFSGNPGHGLAFIQNTAAEKMVSKTGQCSV